MVRRLEQPQVGRAPRLQELHDPAVVHVGRGHVGVAPPRVVAVDRQRELLAVERHAEQLGVLHRRVDVVEVHRLQLRRELRRPRRRLQAARDRSLRSPGVGGGHGSACSHPRSAPELRVQRQHVGERRRAGARQAVDVDRARAPASVLDLGMVAVPGLDLEPVDEAPAAGRRVTRGVAVGAEVGVALEAVEQHVEALAEVAGPEVVEPGRRAARRRAAPRGVGERRRTARHRAAPTRSG